MASSSDSNSASDRCEVRCGGCDVGLFYFASLGDEELVTWLVNHGVISTSVKKMLTSTKIH